MKTLVLLALLGGVSLGRAKPASACSFKSGFLDPCSETFKYEVFGIGAAYAGVTLGMGLNDLIGSEHSTGYGVAEVVIHAPLTVLWGAVMVSDGEAGFSVLALLHASLVAHGIYTIATNSRQQQAGPPPQTVGAFQLGPVTGTVSVAPVRDGVGLGLSGSF